MDNIGSNGFYMADVKDNHEKANFAPAISNNSIASHISRDLNGLITPNDSFLSFELPTQIISPFSFSSSLSTQPTNSPLTTQPPQLPQQLNMQPISSGNPLLPSGFISSSTNNQFISALPYCGENAHQFGGVGELPSTGLSIYQSQQQLRQHQQQLDYQRLQQLQQQQLQQQLQQQQEHDFNAPLVSSQAMFLNTTKVKNCSICGVCETPTWRRHPLNGACVCNACGLYYKLHKRDREFTVNARGQRVVKRQPRGATRRAQRRDREFGTLQLIPNSTVENPNSVPESSVNAQLFGNYL